MNWTQKQHRDTTEKITEAFRLLGETLRARAPQDFEIWFTWAGAEVQAGWSDPASNYEQYLAGKDIVDLLMQWQAVDWRAEAKRAAETRRDRAS